MARGPASYDDDPDDAPWLAEGTPDRVVSTTTVRRGRLVGGILLFAALLALVIIGITIIAGKKQDGGSGYARPEDAPLIAADPGPYKVAPSERGGMTVDGADSTIYATGEGVDPGSSIDIGALPEEPLARPGDAPTSEVGEPVELMPPAAQITAAPVRVEPGKATPPKPKPEVVAVAPAPTAIRIEPTRVTTPKPKDEAAVKLVPGPASLQLGAFSSSAKADAAWKAASGRYAYLAGLSKRIDRLDRDGTTLYRLRAAGVASKAAAGDLCARLKIAGEPCIVAE